MESVRIEILSFVDLCLASNLKKVKERGRPAVYLVFHCIECMRISYVCLKLQLLRTYKCGFAVVCNTLLNSVWAGIS